MNGYRKKNGFSTELKCTIPCGLGLEDREMEDCISK
jgi:hypothetical protein